MQQAENCALNGKALEDEDMKENSKSQQNQQDEIRLMICKQVAVGVNHR